MTVRLALGCLAAAGLLVACAEQPSSDLTIDTTGGASGGEGGGSSVGGPSSAATTGSGTGTSAATTSASTGSGNAAAEAAKAFYVEQVHGAMEKECASCHATGTSAAPIFMVFGDAAATYQKLATYQPITGGAFVTAPQNSTLLLYGSQVHTGPGMSPALQDLTEQWLTMEAEALGGGGGGEGGAGSTGQGGEGGGGTPVNPPKTLDTALKEFGACMSYADWEATGMSKLPLAQVKGGEQCVACHSNGQNGTYLNADPKLTFENSRKFPYIMRLVTGTVDDTLQFADLVPSNRFIEKGGEPCIVEPCHPKYDLPEALVQAVTDFVGITLDKWHAGTCDEEPPPLGGEGGAAPDEP